MQTTDLNKIENPTKCKVLQTSQETLPFVDSFGYFYAKFCRLF